MTSVYFQDYKHWSSKISHTQKAVGGGKYFKEKKLQTKELLLKRKRTREWGVFLGLINSWHRIDDLHSIHI